jgi:transcriptional regulator with XRE-family HTH domain
MGRFKPPTPASSAVGAQLRALRLARGMSMKDAAATLGRSQTWLSRVEAGIIRPRPTDVTALLVVLKVDPDSERGKQVLLALARDPAATGWWQRFDALNPPYVTFIGYEAMATTERNAEPLVVPGLLQTQEYALEVSGVGRDRDAAAIAQRVQARLKRQEVLFRSDSPLILHAIVSEAALELTVGGEAVRRRQLRHIVEMARLPNVTVGVVRSQAGAAAVAQSGFYILEFGDDESPIGYVETPVGELFLRNEIGQLTAIFHRLHAAAMPPDPSLEFIKELACT